MLESLNIIANLYLTYALLMLMGFTLGVMGSGGALLALPILVYVSHISPLKASVFSLVIVGGCALSSLMSIKKNVQLSWNIIPFSVTTVAMIIAMRRLVMPVLVDTYGEKSVELAILAGFVVVMLISSYLMFKPTKPEETAVPNKAQTPHMALFSIAGAGLGALIGFLGVGGGFIIVPLLVLGLNYSMTHATATSLLIVSINSLIGFFLDPAKLTADENIFVMIAIIVSSLGLQVGRHLLSKITNLYNQQTLKRAFAIFMLVIVVFIIYKQVNTI